MKLTSVGQDINLGDTLPSVDLKKLPVLQWELASLCHLVKILAFFPIFCNSFVCVQKFPKTRKDIEAFSQRNFLFVAHIQKTIKPMSMKACINTLLSEGHYEYSD